MMEQSNPPQTQISSPELQTMSPHTSRPNVRVLFLLIPVVVLCWGAYSLGFQKGQESFESNQGTNVLTTTEPSESPEVVPEVISPTSVTAVTKKPTVTPAVSMLRPGWEVHHFPLSKINLAAPKNWQSDFQSFDDGDLIRFWQGEDATTATIQLSIKKNWDNTGDAQYLERKFALGSGIMAAQVDPPKMADKKLDRYQTNYYFEKNGSVYVYQCVHNWIDAQIDICQTMLKSTTFD